MKKDIYYLAQYCDQYGLDNAKDFYKQIQNLTNKDIFTLLSIIKNLDIMTVDENNNEENILRNIWNNIFAILNNNTRNQHQDREITNN